MMKTLDEQLEQSGSAVRVAFDHAASPDPTSIRRRHGRQRAASAGAFAAAALLVGFAIFGSFTTNSSVGSASGGGRNLAAYGLDLGPPWIPGEINHNDGAYDTDYWEVYHYLPTDDGHASSVVVRVTTRPIGDGETAASSVPALAARDAIETSVAGREVGALVNDGNYSYAWIEGNALVDVVVIQMAPGAVTRELAETVVGNVRALTVDERSELTNTQNITPPGPETTLEG